MSRWYRAYEGTVTDAKLGEAALVAECSRSVAIAAWHCILESCATAQRGGEYDTSPRRVAVILGEAVDTIAAVFDAFVELDMIGNGAVTAWNKIQADIRPPAHIWRELRELVFSRDDYTCSYCGKRGTYLECDHIVPVSRGGSSEVKNLTTACKPCNRAKRDKLLSEWVQ
jgi:hypothetical protein